MKHYSVGDDFDIEILVGRTFSKIEVSEDDSEILFTLDDGGIFKMYHTQDCCENVYVKDVNGDLNDLIGAPLLMSKEETNSNDLDENQSGTQESFTWTFYKFATKKGFVTLRWLGLSNGDYSESVDMRIINTSGFIKEIEQKELIGKLARLTKMQTNRDYFSHLPIGTIFIILEKEDLPAYDLLGLFLGVEPHIVNRDGIIKIHFQGYIERGTWEILGKMEDCAEFLRQATDQGIALRPVMTEDIFGDDEIYGFDVKVDKP